VSPLIGFVGNIADTGGASSIGRRSPTKMERKEVTNMEIMEELINEKGKEAVMVDDDFDPLDIADNAYKEWLEERYLKEWKDGCYK
jgi:hypothetical protein